MWAFHYVWIASQGYNLYFFVVIEDEGKCGVERECVDRDWSVRPVVGNVSDKTLVSAVDATS